MRAGRPQQTGYAWESMNTKLFGQYLLERGVIDRDQMLEVIREQQQLNPQVDDLAVALGLLSVSDVDAIRREQLRRDEPFERVAVYMGLLTPSQIEDLTDRRHAKKMLLSQILLSRGYVELDELVLAEYEYKRESMRRSRQLDAILANAGCGEVAAVAVAVLERVFPRMMKDSLRVYDVTANRAIDVGRRLWTQHILVDGSSHMLAIQADDDSATQLASVVLGTGLTGYDELAEDAVAEFLNIVMGHVCGNLAQQPQSVRVLPPRMFSGAEFLREYPGAIVLQCESGDLDFRFSVGSEERTTSRAEPIHHTRSGGERPVVLT